MSRREQLKQDRSGPNGMGVTGYGIRLLALEEKPGEEKMVMLTYPKGQRSRKRA